MFKRLVNVVEVLALIGAAIFVLLLFTNEPDSGGSSGPQTPGAKIYAASCAGCHGSDGGGGTGPQLAGGAAKARFPNVDDQITFVSDGGGAMPAFGGELSPAEIRQVVEYTRTL
jgi:mono/diheme cytochrome c family protein